MSVANGVIANRLQVLDEVLLELSSLGTVEIEALKGDWRTRRAIERDLQVLVKVVIDVCQRLIALAGQAPPSTSGDAVERCIRLGALSDLEAYRRMVRFRNFLVQRYDRIDETVLVDVVNKRLTDFERFRDEVLAYVAAN